jgi:type IV pilus assembly protein PilW
MWTPEMLRPAPRPRHPLIRGYTLVELLVAMVIALFLLAGLLTILQATRQTFNQQTALAQLQDNERLALTLMGDVVASAGYYPNAQSGPSFVAVVGPPSFAAGQSITGASGGGAFGSDTISVRFAPPVTLSSGNVNTNLSIINCTGGTDTQNGSGSNVYTNTFQIDANGNLDCTLSVNGVAQAPVALVSGVKDLQIWYGVETQGGTYGNSVDSYETASQMNSASCATQTPLPCWQSVTSVKIRLTFANPLACSTALVVCPVTSLPAMTTSSGTTVYLERVVAVLARTGVTT